MIDDQPFGLGALPSPPDERDWTIDTLYAAAGLDAVTAPPASFLVPAPYPPILNQGNTPMCVAFSSSTLKAYEDLRDTGPVDLDEPAFFTAIGGGPNGAVVRNALQRMVDVGYPPVANPAGAASHRIHAYYSVPVDELAIQSALMTFGPLLLSVVWHYSWFRPVSGILPAPDAIAGGHAIAAVGWDSRGLRLRNSWGTGYALGGDVFLPWAYLGQVREAWKAVDQVVAPPPAASYRLSFAAGAQVWIATTTPAGCISAWTIRTWGSRPSSAPCKAPVVMRGCARGSAPVALVTAGVFAGKYVRIGTGVSAVRS